MIDRVRQSRAAMQAWFYWRLSRLRQTMELGEAIERIKRSLTADNPEEMAALEQAVASVIIDDLVQ